MVRRVNKKQKDIQHISNLFLVYKQRLKAPEQSVITEVVGVVKDVTGISISKSNCRYNTHTRTVSLQTSGMVKDQIRFHTPEILTVLEKRLGKQNTPHSIL